MPSQRDLDEMDMREDYIDLGMRRMEMTPEQRAAYEGALVIREKNLTLNAIDFKTSSEDAILGYTTTYREAEVKLAEKRYDLAMKIAALTLEQKIAYAADLTRREADLAQRIANYKLFQEGNEFLSSRITPGKYPFIERLREASLAGDFQRMFELMPVSKWRTVPLGKFRFKWGPDGKPRWVTFSKDDMQTYFRGPWLKIHYSWNGQCPEDFINKYAHDYFLEHQSSAAGRPNTHPHHMYRKMFPAYLICAKKRGSLWVRIRKSVMIAVAVVASLYLGPQVLTYVQNSFAAMTGGLFPAAGGTGVATTTAQLTTFQKIQAGTKTLLTYVNRARTIEAVVKGELPPPPIGIPGANFRDWAFIVAKEEIKKAAIDAALEAGVEYVAEKMSEKLEAEIKAEIADMQRQLIALTPPEVLAMPVEPDIELAVHLKKIQVIEEKRKDDLQKFIVPAAIIGGALLFGA